MYCPGCSAENADDARFCGECGNSLTPAPKPAPKKMDPVIDIHDSAEDVPDGLKWGIFAATLFMPLVGIGMGLYFMLSGDSPKKKLVGQRWLWAGLGIGVLYLLLSGGEFDGGGY